VTRTSSRTARASRNPTQCDGTVLHRIQHRESDTTHMTRLPAATSAVALTCSNVPRRVCREGPVAPATSIADDRDGERRAHRAANRACQALTRSSSTWRRTS
jgi:hypothetical protein